MKNCGCNCCSSGFDGGQIFLKVCARLEEERQAAEELRKSLEREKDELRTKLKDTNAEVRRH